jgi:hypothetical protein
MEEFRPLSPPVRMANSLAPFEHTTECPTWAIKTMLLVEPGATRNIQSDPAKFEGPWNLQVVTLVKHLLIVKRKDNERQLKERVFYSPLVLGN